MNGHPQVMRISQKSNLHYYQYLSSLLLRQLETETTAGRPNVIYLRKKFVSMSWISVLKRQLIFLCPLVGPGMFLPQKHLCLAPGGL